MPSPVVTARSWPTVVESMTTVIAEGAAGAVAGGDRQVVADGGRADGDLLAVRDEHIPRHRHCRQGGTSRPPPRSMLRSFRAFATTSGLPSTVVPTAR